MRVARSAEELVGDEFVRWEAIGAEYGYASTVARLFRADGTTCVAKFATADEGRRERRFYEQIAPSTAVRVPGFLGARDDDERSVLFLEDLGHARQGDSECRSLEDCAAVLKQAAALHRTWRGRVPSLPSWGRGPAAMVERLAEQRALFDRRWGAYLPEPGLLEGLPARIAAGIDGPPTVVHSDLHLDNVLFDSGPILMDWQTVAVGPAAVDVARWLFESLTVEQRREHEGELLATYAAESGQPVPQSAIDAFAWRSLAGMVCGFANFDPETCTDRQRRLITADLERISATLC